MTLEEIFEADIENVFMGGDLAQSTTYKRGSSEYQVKAIILEQDLDSEEEISVENTARIYLSKTELDNLGIGDPQIHDQIGGKWEVGSRKLNLGMWELTCFCQVRPKP
ncbi:MAG TPA: hypothetical protein ENF97_01075 [Candidatus Omnitrophica bacterium]|nr:hypothetical protein [Candidatus Omnitrophota bacterium]